MINITVIVISGQPGAGSSTIAKLMAKKLRLRHFSLGDASKKFGHGRETERGVTYLLSRRGRSKSFHEGMEELQRKVARKGDVVIDSKLGIRMLKGLYDFSVWLKCPKSVRAEMIAGRDKIFLKEAMKILSAKERLERKRWKEIYSFDYFDQEKEADLVIDVSEKTPEEIVNKIICASR